VNYVYAEMILPSCDDVFYLLSWDGKQFYAQYQKHIKKKSALHEIHKIVDHDPLKATLAINVKTVSLLLVC